MHSVREPSDDMPSSDEKTSAVAEQRKTSVRAESGGECGLWASCAAEALGAALLLLCACVGARGPPLQRALLAGGTVAALVQCFEHISGAMLNPAVALAGALSGRVCWRRAAGYCGAQLAGAAAGAALARLLGAAPAACVTRPALPAAPAAALEAALTACLALANTAAWDARTQARGDSWPLRIGATVAALSLVAGELTGASMNPARSLGPALCANDWRHHWVYWAGPLAGAAGAALLYRACWRPRPPARARLTV